MSLKPFAGRPKLTHFADLTPHTYSNVTDGEIVLNVGWLCGSQPYNTGAASREFQTALADLVARPVMLHRGTHACNLGDADCPCGNGQIRVLGLDDIWYSAPTLVHHYVVDHHYLPPLAFISAVLDGVAVMIEP